jgi:hypothetical protein
MSGVQYNIQANIAVVRLDTLLTELYILTNVAVILFNVV